MTLLRGLVRRLDYLDDVAGMLGGAVGFDTVEYPVGELIYVLVDVRLAKRGLVVGQMRETHGASHALHVEFVRVKQRDDAVFAVYLAVLYLSLGTENH